MSPGIPKFSKGQWDSTDPLTRKEVNMGNPVPQLPGGFQRERAAQRQEPRMLGVGGTKKQTEGETRWKRADKG